MKTRVTVLGALLVLLAAAVAGVPASFHAEAPSRHLATVITRAPLSNSPITHVHAPEPNLIGWDATGAGVAPPFSSTYAFTVQCARGYRGSWLPRSSPPAHRRWVAGGDASPITQSNR
jgi:hypothetical protein